ncbi:hypothetical protein H0O00_05390 [Candidatus Micrarchaeota archaeon]|nr:hypothetical protein [Candidatus Micrarchaeota archaeon]
MNNRMKVGLRGAVAAAALATALNGGLPTYAQPKTEPPMRCENAALEKVHNVLYDVVKDVINNTRLFEGENSPLPARVAVRLDVQVNTKGKISVKRATPVFCPGPGGARIGRVVQRLAELGAGETSIWWVSNGHPYVTCTLESYLWRSTDAQMVYLKSKLHADLEKALKHVTVSVGGKACEGNVDVWIR